LEVIFQHFLEAQSLVFGELECSIEDISLTLAVIVIQATSLHLRRRSLLTEALLLLARNWVTSHIIVVAANTALGFDHSELLLGFHQLKWGKSLVTYFSLTIVDLTNTDALGLV